MQISKRFRNGMVLMIYHSITSFGSRETDLGPGGDEDLIYWYCMNGLGEMVNKSMISKFPRCESTAGDEDGDNDTEMLSHNHVIGSGGVPHTHSLPDAGEHSHGFDDEFMANLSTLGAWLSGLLEWLPSNSDFYRTTSDGWHSHTYGAGGAHAHSLENPGVSGTGKNMPYYKTICFIQRKK